VSRVCRATSPKCPSCAGPYEYKDCQRSAAPKCLNCGGNHSAAYKGCTKHKLAVVITQLAVSKHISYAEALKNRAAEQRRFVGNAAPARPLVRPLVGPLFGPAGPSVVKETIVGPTLPNPSNSTAPSRQTHQAGTAMIQPENVQHSAQPKKTKNQKK